MKSEIRRSLSEVHEWAVANRNIRENDETNEPVDVVVIVGEPGDDSHSIEVVQAKLNELLDALNDFDCLFHDHFDCR